MFLRYWLFLGLGVWPLPARADAGGPAPAAQPSTAAAPGGGAPAQPIDPAEAEASALLERGIQLRKAGDDRQALAAFEAAYARDRSPRALAQIALAEQALGRWVDAQAHLAAALAVRSDRWIVDHWQSLQAAEREIASHLGRLEVSCNVSGARVALDGRALGRTPLAPTVVMSGQSVLEVEAVGFFEIKRSVQVDPNRLSRVDVVLTPIETANEKPGRDGRAQGGEVTKPGVSRDVFMAGSLGLAGLGLVAGVTGYVVRERYVHMYNDDRRCAQQPGVRRSVECADEFAAWRRGEQVAVAGFASVAVFGGVGLYLWLTRPEENRASSVACAFGAASASCSGRF